MRASNPWSQRLWNLLALILALGVGVGGLLAAYRVFDYSTAHRVWWILPIVVSSVDRGLLLAPVLLVLSALLFRVSGLWLRDGLLRSLSAVGGVALPLCAYAMIAVNRRHLPGLFEPASIVGNALMGLGFLSLWGLASLGLLRWRQSYLSGAKRVHPIIVAILVAAPVGLHIADLPGSDERPNLIVILIDVLRADHLGAYGYARDTSPRIDEFSRDAVVFTQAISQSTFTKTSVASLFTGLYPHHHGVYHGEVEDELGQSTSDVLARDFDTLADLLLAQDVHTVAWVSNAQLRAYMGFDQGFIRYEDQAGSVEEIVGGFLRWQRRFGERHPFFAYLHILDLHDPYLPGAPFDTLFGVHSDSFRDMGRESWLRYRQGVKRGRIRPSRAEIEQLEASYDGLIRFIDGEVGRLLQGIRAAGLYDRSLIVLTSDHGDGFMEHDFISHSNTPYEELVRVPLIVKLPHSAHAGLRIGAQVSLVDLFPTALEIFGARNRLPLDGASLLPLLDGRPEVRTSGKYTVSEFNDQIAVRTERWKYLALPSQTPELYDLREDEAERRNVVDLHPEVAEPLERIAEEIDRTKMRRKATQVGVDPDTAAELRALGYLE